MRLKSLNHISLRIPWRLCLWLWLLATASSAAATSTQEALQQAILDGLASGQEVSALLNTWQHQSVPVASTPRRLRHTVAEELHERLLALRQALKQVAQTPASASARTALIHAYQQVQASHMLMAAHLQSVEHALADATLPGTLSTRQQDSAGHYHNTLEQLLST